MVRIVFLLFQELHGVHDRNGIKGVLTVALITWCILSLLIWFDEGGRADVGNLSKLFMLFEMFVFSSTDESLANLAPFLAMAVLFSIDFGLLFVVDPFQMNCVVLLGHGAFAEWALCALEFASLCHAYPSCNIQL